MKKLIAVLLVVVLIGGGLGGFAYAQEPVNHVFAHFNTQWIYDVPGDSFTSGDVEVTGGKSWWAALSNPEDETAAPVTGLNLSLATELAFDDTIVLNGNLVTEGPPVYEWSFGDADEGLPFPHIPFARVQFWGPPYPFPVTFTPGLNASRSADKTEFLQSEGTQTQTLTINLTPLEQQATEDFALAIAVIVPPFELVDTVINPPTGVEFALTPDEQGLWIYPIGLTVEEEWTTTVTIEVTPKVAEVAFMPVVWIGWFEFLAFGTESGGSLSRPAGDPADDVGTWTWSATGDYAWDWGESVERALQFATFCEAIIEPVPHESMTGQKLVGKGANGTADLPDIQISLDTSFFFTNPDCVAEITIERISIIRDDGNAIYEGPLLQQITGAGLEVVDDTPWTEPMKPHEIRYIFLQSYFADPGDPEHDWMNWYEAGALPVRSYTVEIFWTHTGKKGLPLTGWTYESVFKTMGEVVTDKGFGTQMVNMEQELKPPKPPKPPK